MFKLISQIQNFWVAAKGYIMALHDQDKENGDRANPKPNDAGDNVVNRMSHKTMGTTYKTTGNPDTNRLIFDKGTVKGFDDQDNNNIFIGYSPDVSPRPIIKVAKDGFSVEDGDENLIFNSEQNVFKIVKSGTFTSTTAPSTSNPGAGQFAANQFTLGTIPHGLSYIPSVIAYVGTGTGYQLMPSMSYAAAGTNAGWYTFNVEVDATNIYFYLQTMRYGTATSFSAGFPFRYYLLQESAT